MTPVETFKVFGEPVEILVSGEMTGGLSTTLTQTSPPGGGPPPHSHEREDETFFVLEGDYELLQDGRWHKVSRGASRSRQAGRRAYLSECGDDDRQDAGVCDPSRHGEISGRDFRADDTTGCRTVNGQLRALRNYVCAVRRARQ